MNHSISAAWERNGLRKSSGPTPRGTDGETEAQRVEGTPQSGPAWHCGLSTELAATLNCVADVDAGRAQVLQLM